MANAHSHAFQRDLRGLAERPGARDDFWSWRTEMYAPRAGARPRLDARRRPRASTPRWSPPATARSASSTTSTTSPTARRTTSPNAMAIAVAEAARRRPACDRHLPLPSPGGADRPRRPSQRASATPTSRRFLRARRRAARVGRRARRRRRSASPRTACARCRPLARGDRRLRRATHGLVRHVHAHEQRARARRVPRRARLLADRAARAHRLPRAAHERRPRHPRDRRATSPCWRDTRHDRRLLPDDRGQPRRRLPAGAAPTATPACALAIGSDSQVRVDPFEEARELETGARREGQTRRALLADHGDLWGELARNGWRSLGLEGGARSTSTSTIPTCAASRQDELPLALATCASAGVVCRQASRVRAGGGSLS